MAGVTSKSKAVFRVTAPSEESTGPSIAGRPAFQVMAVSLHVQLEMAWICPPELLSAPAAPVTCRRTLALLTARVPSPVTWKRRNVCLAVSASTARVLAVPNLVVGEAALGDTSAVMTAVLQAGGGPPTQSGPTQMSPVVQGLPSSHSAFGDAVPITHVPAPSHALLGL